MSKKTTSNFLKSNILCCVALFGILLIAGFNFSNSIAQPLKTEIKNDAAGQYQELQLFAQKGVLFTLQKSTDLDNWSNDLSFIGSGQQIKLRLFALNTNVLPENGNDASYETVSVDVRAVTSGGTYISWISMEDQTIKHLHLPSIELDTNFPESYAGVKNGYYLFMTLNNPVIIMDSDSAVTGKDLDFKNALASILAGINNETQNGIPPLRPHRPAALGGKQFWRIKSDSSVDSDGDGVPNIDEIANGTNPFDEDSDNDGEPDSLMLDSDEDGIADINDADPFDKVVNWKRITESSYKVTDLGLPSNVILDDSWSKELGEGNHVLISKDSYESSSSGWEIPSKSDYQTYVWAGGVWSDNLPLPDNLRGAGRSIDAEGNVHCIGFGALETVQGGAVAKRLFMVWKKNYDAFSWDEAVAEQDGNLGDDFSDEEETFGYESLLVFPYFEDERLLFGRTSHFTIEDVITHEDYMTLVKRMSPEIGDPILISDSNNLISDCRLVGGSRGWHFASWENENSVDYSSTQNFVFSKFTEPETLTHANPPTGEIRHKLTNLSSIQPRLLPDHHGDSVSSVSDIVIWQTRSSGLQIGHRADSSSDFVWQASTKATQRINGKINSRGEGLLGSSLWRNGNWTPLNDLVDSISWPDLQGIDINDSGAILAVSAGRLILLQPIEVDLDVDADNTTVTGYPDLGNGDRGSTEEEAEDSDDEDTYPGVRVYANYLDFDKDRVPGYADGIDKFGNGVAGSCDNFEPMILDLGQYAQGYPNLEVVFKYDESDPEQLSMDRDYYILPEGGVLRIWKKNGGEIRKPASAHSEGDFVKSEQVYAIEDLGQADENGTIRLFIEAVDEYATHQSYRIVMKLYPEGKSNGDKVEMAVKARPYRISTENPPRKSNN